MDHDENHADWSSQDIAWGGLTLTAQNSSGGDANVPSIERYYIKGRGTASSGSTGGTASRVPGCTSDAPRCNILRPRAVQLPCSQGPRHYVPAGVTVECNKLPKPAGGPVEQSTERTPLKGINPFPGLAVSPTVAAGKNVTSDGHTAGNNSVRAVAPALPLPASSTAAVVASEHGLGDLGCRGHLQGGGSEGLTGTRQASPNATKGAGGTEPQRTVPTHGSGGSDSSTSTSDGDSSEEAAEHEETEVPRFNLLRRPAWKACTVRQPAGALPSSRVVGSGSTGGNVVALPFGVALPGHNAREGAAAAGSGESFRRPIAAAAKPTRRLDQQDLAGLSRNGANQGGVGSGVGAVPMSSNGLMASTESVRQSVLQQNDRAPEVHAVVCQAPGTAGAEAATRLQETPPKGKPDIRTDGGSRDGRCDATETSSAPRSGPASGRLRLGRSARRVSSPMEATTPAAPPALPVAMTATGAVRSGPGSSSDDVLARAIQTAHHRRRSAPAPLRSLFEEGCVYDEAIAQGPNAQQQQQQQQQPQRTAGDGFQVGGVCLISDRGHANPEDLQGALPPNEQWERPVRRRQENENRTPVLTRAVSASPLAAPWDAAGYYPDDGCLPDDYEVELQGNGWGQGADLGADVRVGQQQQEQREPHQPQWYDGNQQVLQPQEAGKPMMRRSPSPQGFKQSQQRPSLLQQERQLQEQCPQPIQHQKPHAQTGSLPPLPQQQPPSQLPPRQHQLQLAHAGSRQGHGQTQPQTSALAAKRRAGATTTKAQQQNAAAAAGTQSIISFLLRKQQAALPTSAPVSAASSPVNAEPHKRPQLRLSAPESGGAVTDPLPIAVADPPARYPVIIDLADDDAGVGAIRRATAPTRPHRRASIGTVPPPVVVLLDDDEGATRLDKESGGLRSGTRCVDDGFAGLEDEDVLEGGNEGRAAQLKRGLKRRRPVLICDDDDEEDVEEEGKEHGGAELHDGISSASASNGAGATVAGAGAARRQPLLRVPQQIVGESEEDDAIEDCSQDGDEEVLGLPPTRNFLNSGCGGNAGCAAKGTGHPTAGRHSLGAAGGSSHTEATRRLSLPMAAYLQRQLPSGPQTSGAELQRPAGTGRAIATDGMGQVPGARSATPLVQRPQQQGLPSQPDASGHPLQQQQNQQQQDQHAHQATPHHQQQQQQQQEEQQQQAPWWTLLLDFVPAAALAGGYDPRPGPRPEPVFILYQKQFNGPANSSVTPIHRNTWHQPPAPPGAAGPSSWEAGFSGGCAGGGYRAGASNGGDGCDGADNELLDWARDLRGGKARGGNGSGSRSKRMADAAGAAAYGGQAADAGGAGGGRWYTNNFGVRVYVENGQEYTGREAYKRYRRPSGAGADAGTAPSRSRARSRRKGSKGKGGKSRSKSGAGATAPATSGGVAKKAGKGKKLAGAGAATGMWLGKGKGAKGK